MEDNTPMEITIDDINDGMKAERTVIIKSKNEQYNGKAVRIRTLRGREFRAITQKTRLAGKDDLAGAFALSLEACKLGIVTPGIKEHVEDLDEDVILQVGGEIMATSEPKEGDVQDFSIATKGS